MYKSYVLFYDFILNLRVTVMCAGYHLYCCIHISFFL